MALLWRLRFALCGFSLCCTLEQSRQIYSPFVAIFPGPRRAGRRRRRHPERNMRTIFPARPLWANIWASRKQTRRAKGRETQRQKAEARSGGPKLPILKQQIPAEFFCTFRAAQTCQKRAALSAFCFLLSAGTLFSSSHTHTMNAHTTRLRAKGFPASSWRLASSALSSWEVEAPNGRPNGSQSDSRRRLSLPKVHCVLLCLGLRAAKGSQTDRQTEAASCRQASALCRLWSMLFLAARVRCSQFAG